MTQPRSEDFIRDKSRPFTGAEFLLLAIVLVLNAVIALVTRWRGAHAEGVVLAGAPG